MTITKDEEAGLWIARRGDESGVFCKNLADLMTILIKLGWDD